VVRQAPSDHPRARQSAIRLNQVADRNNLVRLGRRRFEPAVSSQPRVRVRFGGSARNTGLRRRISANADGALCIATMRKASFPSLRYIAPNLASQMRVAFASMAWNTGPSSPGDELMTRSTSDAAVCCSRASASSRVRALTCSCRLARELAGRASVGALLRLGFVVLACCAFAGLRLIVRRCLTEPFTWAGDHRLPHHGVRCAPQQIHSRLTAMGHKPALPCRSIDVRFAPNKQTLAERVQCDAMCISGCEQMQHANVQKADLPPSPRRRIVSQVENYDPICR
jgi:hypothetical protein